MWVRSEYAGELAVLTTWFAALIPWNVTFANLGDGALLFVRFPLFQVRYTFGVPIATGIAVVDPVTATAFQGGQALELPYRLWTVGAGIFAAALVVSAVYYRREAWAESWPVDPVRLLGTLLLATGIVLAAATYFLLSRGFPGIPIPIGVVFLLLFGVVLLTVDRTE